MTFRIISDPAAQEVALRGGEINFMELTNAEAVKIYSADPAYRVVKYPEAASTTSPSINSVPPCRTAASSKPFSRR